MQVQVTFTQGDCTPRSLQTTKKLGSSKFEVFHAQDTLTSTDYAIKLFPHTDTAKICFERECQLLSRLDHPNIVKQFTLKDYVAGGSDALVLEYANYGDFFDLVSKGGFEHDVFIRTYFHQLIEGLEYLHSQGIAHLDLKLDNLLLSKDCTLKITDFEQSQTKGDEALFAKGTNSYRSPELKKRECKNLFAADIYSAGVVLFCFKTRQFPFFESDAKGDQPGEIFNSLFVNNNVEYWENKAKTLHKKSNFFPEDFRVLLNGMLDPNPIKRFTIDQIKANEWYNKPTFVSEGLKSQMAQICKKLAPPR